MQTKAGVETLRDTLARLEHRQTEYVSYIAEHEGTIRELREAYEETCRDIRQIQNAIQLLEKEGDNE